MLGIIGGIAPASTIEYYRLLVSSYRARAPGGDYPRLLINSINLKDMLGPIERGDLTGATAFLSGEIERVIRAGAQLALFASNTPHIVFDEVQRRSSIPLISIVEATCEVVATLGLKTVGLLGTRFTMEATFYPAVFSRAGISVVVPPTDDLMLVHEKYMNELIQAVYSDETREAILSVVDRMHEKQGSEGVILGGTELPLLMRMPSHRGQPLLDTTRIHVERAVTEMLAVGSRPPSRDGS